MHRRVDWMTTPLAHLEAIGHAMDCTVNDVVLASVAALWREYLILPRVHPARFDFRGLCAGQVRGKEDRASWATGCLLGLSRLPIARRTPASAWRRCTSYQ